MDGKWTGRSLRWGPGAAVGGRVADHTAAASPRNVQDTRM